MLEMDTRQMEETGMGDYAGLEQFWVVLDLASAPEEVPTSDIAAEFVSNPYRPIDSISATTE